MKKLVSLFLASLLSLSLFTVGPNASALPKEPDLTPAVTVQPSGPSKPGELPAEPQDDLPPPIPVEYLME